MTTGMAAQGVGPRERVPQTAQTLNVSVLANGEACTVPGVVFTAPAACRSCVWHLLGTLGAPSPGWLPGRDAEAAA